MKYKYVLALFAVIVFSASMFAQSKLVSFSADINTGVMYHDNKTDLVVDGKKVDAKDYEIVLTITAKEKLDKLFKLLKQLEKEGYEFELKVNPKVETPKYSIWGGEIMPYGHIKATIEDGKL